MLREIIEAKYRGLNGVKGTDIIITYPKDGKLYGIFSKEALKNASDDKLNDFDIANILDTVDDMELMSSENGDISPEDKKYITSINKWVKQFGVQKDFDSFEPDSKDQTYLKI